jgi:DNA polymerase phi
MLGDYILTMIRRVNTADKTEEYTWVETYALPQLASLAYSKNQAFTPSISAKARSIFRNRLNSAFAHLISDSNGFSYPCNLLQTLKPTAVDMDEHLSAARDEAVAVVGKLLKKSNKAAEDEKKPLQAFAMLYALVIFQLYNGESDAVSLLDELRLCYDKLIRGKDNTESKSEASVVLVEILLSFMSKQSVLLRKIAQQVFIAFSGEITEEGLKLLVDVLDCSESLKGQHELFDQDDDELERGDEDEDDELDFDVEVLDTNRINGHDKLDTASEKDDEESDDGEEDEDEDEQGEEDDDDEEAQKLDDALAKALGTHRADQDPKEDTSDSEADMSDSEMMELDAKLVEIFSQRKKEPNKKQEKKDARENIINFKTRVLDLLEIYVKEQAATPFAFDLLLPLLKLIRTTSAKQLIEKAHKVIANFSKAAKGLKPTENPATFDQSQRLQILKNIHEEASKDQSHAFAKAASTASLLVATTLYRTSKSNNKKIANVYRDTHVKLLDGDVKMQASFVLDWANWVQSHSS